MLRIRQIILAGLVLSVLCIGVFSGGQIGFSIQQSGGQTLVSSSSHPIMMLWAICAIVFVLVLFKWKLTTSDIETSGLWRRFGSFLIDLYVSVLVGGSFLALIPLGFEAKRTGHFSWSFARDYSVLADPYVFKPLAYFSTLVPLLYFVFALTQGSPTIGDFVTGLQVTNGPSKAKKFGLWAALKRILWSGLGVSLWPYTLIRGRDKKGRTWYDRMSDCDVTIVSLQISSK